MNMPATEFLTAPLWLITLLHIVTLSLHLIAMNLLFGGVLGSLWCRIKKIEGSKAYDHMVKLLPNLMAATISLGVAPLLFVQLVYPKQIYSSSITSGWFWLFIPMVVIVIYYSLYGLSFSKKVNNLAIWYLSAALLGMMYVSVVYSSVFSTAENPNLNHVLYNLNQSGTILNLFSSSFFYRWLHMITGAMAVGGLFVTWLGKDEEELFSIGKQLFFWGMGLAAVTGLLYLLFLGEALLLLMRSPGIHTLTVGIILAAGSLHFFMKKRFVPASMMVFVSVICMVATRHYLRLIRLDEFYQPSTIPVQTDWSIVSLFLLSFVIAIVMIWYMLKLFFSKSQAS